MAFFEWRAKLYSQRAKPSRPGQRAGQVGRLSPENREPPDEVDLHSWAQAARPEGHQGLTSFISNQDRQTRQSQKTLTLWNFDDVC